jgi:dihydropteroate synthase
MHHILTPTQHLRTFHSPIVMAIMNVTPDSFHVASRVQQEDQILSQAEQHITEGAEILDIGGVSTRPGAALVSEQAEADRVLAAIEVIKRAFPETLISIDTWRASIARQAVAAGADLVNDISAGSLDADLFETVAHLRVPYILMHMQGTPQTMQINPTYQNVTLEVIDFLTEKLRTLRALGVRDIWIDPGFGFGKTIEHNFELLRNFDQLAILGCPLLVGVSRKGMIYKTLGTDAAGALAGTTAAHMAALERGASVLRVHDVLPARQCVQIWEAMRKA